MSLGDELANNLGELNAKDIDKKSVVAEESKNSSAKKESFVRKNLSKIIFGGIFALIVWYKYFYNPNSAINPPPSNQNTASALEAKEEVKQSQQPLQNSTPATNANSIEKQNAVASVSSENNASIQSTEQWQSHIEYLFLNKQANVRLDMQYPIIEVGALNIVSNQRIDLAEYNAYIEPVFFVTRGSEILLNVKIVKADETQVFIDKSYNLADYGFKPLYFEDCIVYNNQVYLPNDKILFFNVKSIETQDNFIRVVYNYLDQNIVVVQENNGN